MSKVVGNTVGTPISPQALVEKTTLVEQVANLSEQIVDLKENGTGSSGLTQAQITALDNMFKKCAYTDDVFEEYTAFKQAFGIESDNEPDTPVEPETGVSNETTWTHGVEYTYDLVQNEYVETNGTIKTYNSWHRTPYLNCDGASTLRVELIADNSGTNSTNNGYNCFYDENKNFISSFRFAQMTTTGQYSDVEIPSNAKYFIVSHKGNVMTTPYIKFIPYA